MRKIVVGLIIFSLITVGIAYTTKQSNTEIQSLSFNNVKGFRTTSFVLNTTLPEVPKRLMVYECAEPNVTLEYVSQLAKQFGMNGQPKKEVFGEFVLTDGKYHLEVNTKSGRLAYTDASRWMVGNNIDKPSNLPSDKEAVKLARNYLSEKGLMPVDAVLRDVTHPRVVAMDKEGNIIGVGFEDVKVSFTRKINGFPAVGAGSKLDVEIGGNGEI